MTREEKAHSLGQEYFPDESNIWARANYEAQWVADACIKMVEWEHKTMIEKACEWLEENYYNVYQGTWQEIKEQFINDFKKAMEE